MFLTGCAVAGAPQVGNGAGPDAGNGTHPPSDASGVTNPDGNGTSGCAYSGVLATWTFAGAAGSQLSTGAASTGDGAVASSIGRASSLTATAGSGSINASNWATSSQRDMSKYYTLSIMPPAGCAMSLTAMAIDVKASSTGPGAAVVATSDDSFAQTASISTSASSTATLSVTGATSAVELRVYGFAASGLTGTMRVQNTLTVSGVVQ